MVVKIRSRVMAPPALVPELEEGAQDRCYLASTLVVKLIYIKVVKTKVLKLLRSESSIKIMRPAIDSILRENSWVKEDSPSATSSSSVKIKRLRLQKSFRRPLFRDLGQSKS
jgi:hypothetical protein